MSTAATTPPPAAGKPPIPQDPAAIQAAIQERQRRLATTVDELSTRLKPQELVRRAKQSAQHKAQDAVTAPDGSLRTERLVAIGAAVAGLLTMAVVRRARR